LDLDAGILIESLVVAADYEAARSGLCEWNVSVI
jgi:hypothetical protein